MIRKLFTGPRVLRNRINQIIDAVERLSTISGDGFIKVNKTNSGVSLGLNIEKLRPRVWNRRQKTPLSAYLITKWLFNGDYKDTSGNDNHLTNAGCSIENNTLKSADGDYTYAASALIPLDSDFTVCGWFRSNVSDYQIVVSQRGGAAINFLHIYCIASGFSNAARVYFDNGTFLISTTTGLNDGHWHHLAITRKGSSWTLYLDNVAEDTASSSTAVGNEATRVSGYSTGVYAMEGNVDDVRIYNKALEAYEIGQVIEEGLGDRSFASGKVFAVQSAGTGDGIYNCYEQTLDATEWDDTAGNDKFDNRDTGSVEVFNLLENDPVASYSPALTVGDAIKAWQWIDDEGNKRWAGIPLAGGFVRQAKTQVAAGAATTISCKLVDEDGNEIGSAITVNCRTTQSADLNVAIPRLASGDYITVYNQGGKWWCTMTFQASEDCLCN